MSFVEWYLRAERTKPDTYSDVVVLRHYLTELSRSNLALYSHMACNNSASLPNNDAVIEYIAAHWDNIPTVTTA